MTCFSDSSIFNFPRTNSSEYNHNIREIEVAAATALKNINVLYDEIMSPKDCQSDDPKVYCNDVYEFASNGVERRQNHFVKSCCSTLLELCATCDKLISQCSSCNRCSCITSKANSLKNKNTNLTNTKNQISPTSTQNKLLVKCTMPEPFSFYDKSEEWQKARKNKISKLKEEINTKIEEELTVRVCSKPVPKTTHLPLYSQMVQKTEKRKIERKEKCVELLHNTKPFNLHTKESMKSKSSLDLTAERTGFKAKPVPKHILSNKITEKMQRKEEIRKMLITERAKDLLEKSASPISKKSISHSRSMVDLLNCNKSNSTTEPKKNISEITKRLYAKKCNETMKSWNKTVSEVNHNSESLKKDLFITEQIALSKKGLSEMEPYPFMYFPVRMSNAAMLRERQIRTEILARKEREEQRHNEELVKKKINTDILHKLRNLVPPSEWEKEVSEKVRTFRESQMRRKEEYEKELEEIMQRVSKQTLLLERITKNTKIKSKATTSQKSSKTDEGSQELSENDESSHESVSSESDDNVQKSESSADS